MSNPKSLAPAVQIWMNGAPVDSLNALPVNASVSIGSVTVSGADTVTVAAATITGPLPSGTNTIGAVSVIGGAGSSTVTVAAATINAATITGGSLGISSLPAVDVGTLPAITGDVGVTSLPAITINNASVTPAAGTATIGSSVAGTAVTIVAANQKGAWITNADTVDMFVDPVTVAGTVAGGTTFSLAPGQTFVAIPGSTIGVTGNSTKANHVFSCVQWS